MCILVGKSVQKKDNGLIEELFFLLNQNATKWNDNNFQNFKYGNEHQVAIIPLNSLQLGLILQVPIDYMHLTLIAVMSKFLSAWIRKFGNKVGD